MRVIGGKDYYDCIGAGGDPDGPVYNRVTKSVCFDVFHPGAGPLTDIAATLGPALTAFLMMPISMRQTSSQTPPGVERMVVLFCGKLYGYYRYKLWFSNKYVTFRTPEEYYKIATANKAQRPYRDVFSREIEEFRDLVDSRPTIRYSSSSRNHHSDGVDMFLPFNKHGWAAWSARFEGMKISDDVNRSFDFSPIILINLFEGNRDVLQLTQNPNLGNCGFASILDPASAYQELDMFLGNNLARQPDPIPARTDELIRDAHGFDHTSFKSGADKRKRKQR